MVDHSNKADKSKPVDSFIENDEKNGHVVWPDTIPST